MKVIKDGKKVEMTYEAICKELEFLAEIHFVKITSASTVSFTAGKPQEIIALWTSVNRHGYKPSQKFKEAVDSL